MSVAQEKRVSVFASPWVAGGLAGLIGGLAFGAMMAAGGMLPMVGMLVGQESAAVGFFVHLVISVGLGIVYGLAAGRLPAGWPAAAVAGLVYGAIWWVLGALVLMPLMLGMAAMVLVIGPPQWMSLMGHLVYGLLAALTFLRLRPR
jgi:uncharacterized membrane protein YagU involved in acid resistance